MNVDLRLAQISRRQAVRAGLAGAAWVALTPVLAACGAGTAAPAPSSQAASAGASSGSASAASLSAATKPSAGAPAASVQASVVAKPNPSSAISAAAVPASAVPVPASAAATCNGTVTPSETDGPYFKAGSPLKSSLVEPGISGTRLMLSGYVFNKQCQPLPQALVDVWQADDAGQYDNAGYRLRGHVLADQTGRYQIETIVPGLYPGRTRHIHVTVQPPNGPILTTQLYFPGEARNSSDGIFDKSMLLPIADAPNGKQATFNFVLNVA